jgi:hypothetical protein
MEKESGGESGSGSSGRSGGSTQAGGRGAGRRGRGDAWSETEIEALHKAVKACGGKLSLKLANEVSVPCFTKRSKGLRREAQSEAYLSSRFCVQIFDNVAELAKRSPRAILAKYQSLGTLATQATDNNNSDSDSDHSAYSNVARKASRAEMHMDIDNNSEYDSDHSAYSNVARKASRVKLNRRIVVDNNSDSDSDHSDHSNVARKASRVKLNQRIVVDSDSG